MLDNSAIQPIVALATVARDHGILSRKKALVVSELRLHSCTWSCLVRSADAQAAGQLSAAQVIPGPPREIPPKAKDVRKHSREEASHRHLQVDEVDLRECAINWPQVESEEGLNQVRLWLNPRSY
jgi:hypothetical protein